MRLMIKLFSTLLVTFLLGTTVAHAQFDALTGIPGLTDSGDIGLAGFINRILVLAISIGGLLAVVRISVAGFKYMFTDIVSSKQGAKEDIYGALLGLGILLAGVLILVTINPNLKNLDVFKNAEKVTIVDGNFSSEKLSDVPPPKVFEEGEEAAAEAYAKNNLKCPAPFEPKYEDPVWGKPRAFCDDSAHRKMYSGTIYVAKPGTEDNKNWRNLSLEEREGILERQAGLVKELVLGCQKYSGFQADINKVNVAANMNTGYWQVDCESTR